MVREEHSDDEGDHGEWNLGFAEPPEQPADLLRHRFPSKIGGRPAWLDPVHLPCKAQLTCATTGDPLRFLLQVYGPVDDAGPDAFHRSVFVFVSPSGDKLAQRGAVRALRCQLPRDNPYYSPTPSGPGDLQPPRLSDSDAAAAAEADPWQSYAAETAAAAPGGQPAASAASPPSSSESSGGSGARGTPKLFREMELVVEPEPSEDEDSPEVQRVLRSYQERVQEEGEYDEDELPADIMGAFEDEAKAHFAMFQARCARAPEQCLRYCFQAGTTPLWPSCANRPKPSDIPDCPRCGRPRRFEFQVMPQLINFLEEDEADPHAPDWGTIAVYSCPVSCSVPVGKDGSAYVEEFVWVQPSH